MESKIFHNREYKRIDCLDSRFYTKNNENYYPSVTTVLEAYPKGHFFYNWLKENGDNADTILSDAGREGSNVHNAIDAFNSGKPIYWQNPITGTYEYSFLEWQMICRYIDFFKVFKPEIIASEVTLVSDHYQIGGTTDLVVMLNGVRWLIDLKTSNNLYETYDLQTACYAKMWNEAYPDKPIEKTGILWLKAHTRGYDKTNKRIQGEKWQLVECGDIESNFFVFQNLHVVWRHKNPNPKPKIFTLPDAFSIESILQETEIKQSLNIE